MDGRLNEFSRGLELAYCFTLAPRLGQFHKLSSKTQGAELPGRFVELLDALKYLGIFRGQTLNLLLAEMRMQTWHALADICT